MAVRQTSESQRAKLMYSLIKDNPPANREEAVAVWREWHRKEMTARHDKNENHMLVSKLADIMSEMGGDNFDWEWPALITLFSVFFRVDRPV